MISTSLAASPAPLWELGWV